MPRSAYLVGPGLAGLIVIASCGARTGLDIPLYVDGGALREAGRHDATKDAPRDAPKDVEKDVFADVVRLEDGHMLDVVTECATPTYCVANDPNYIYKCGQRIFQCGSLEQCEERCGDGGGQIAEAGVDASGCTAKCVDPCLDSLGQNTSNGCEFYAAEMDMTEEAAGVCYAVFVVNQWTTGQPAQLAVDLGGTLLDIEQFARIPTGTGENIVYSPYSATQGIPQGDVAILFLSRDPSEVTNPAQSPDNPAVLANCPPGVTPAVVGTAGIHGTGINNAFHIRSNVPVVAYQMLPYGGGSARVTGATLLLPTNVWGNQYLAANAYAYPDQLIAPDGNPTDPLVQGAYPSLAVLSQADDTHVTINPVTAILGAPGVPPTDPGVPITYTLDQGQYLQISQLKELSGSSISSDKPVAVISASALMDIPVTNEQRADHGEQMIPPLHALGNEYVAVRFRTRTPPVEESDPWRIITAVDGTNLTFDPPQTGAPTTMNAQQVAEFEAPGPFVVSSQDSLHPFYFAQYMTGGGEAELLDPDAGFAFLGIGDPEYVNVIPPPQFLSKYTFFTDPTYPETNVVVVRVVDAASGLFPDVRLDCAGLLTGWQAVGSSGKYQFTRIDLSSGNFQGQNGCNNGVHTIAGSFPKDEGGLDASTGSPFFGATIWGWGAFATDPQTPGGLNDADETHSDFTLWVSYGYPAGVNITNLNSVNFP
jgi:IgGFc binding protein